MKATELIAELTRCLKIAGKDVKAVVIDPTKDAEVIINNFASCQNPENKYLIGIIQDENH